MKTIILALFACVLGACQNDKLQKAYDDLDASQKSNQKLASDLSVARAHVVGLETQIRDTCSAMDVALANMAPTTHVVGEGPTKVAGIPLSVYKVDPDNGWVYLKYTSQDQARYSDRLWFEGDKRDRNSLLIRGEVLVSVDQCTETECTITSRVLSEIRNVCNKP